MSAKIKFSFIKMFFRLFSFLADKTGGWKIFVQPKLMLGTMILGFGVAACNSTGKQKTTCYEVVGMPDVTQTDNIKIVKCYEGNITDSALLQEMAQEFTPPKIIGTTCYITSPSCYDVIIETDTIQTGTIIIDENDTTSILY